MTKTNPESRRLPWTTPQLKRIEAGSAEAKKNSGVSDGATTGTVKS